MNDIAAFRASGAAARAEALIAAYESVGYLRADPPVLQPAEPFLDLSGEDIRKSLFLTNDARGDFMCLRPDLTIPVARDYLASPRNGQQAAYTYLGAVFRSRDGGQNEFLQGGIESFGRADRAAADAEILFLGLEATRAFGMTDVDIRVGDVALFRALITALDLAPAWRRRLIKDFNRKVSLAKDLQTMQLGAGARHSDYQGVLAALAGSNREAALALVTDLMSIAGAAQVGGRSNAEIADRFLEQSTLTGGPLPDRACQLIERFLAIGGDCDEALAQLRALASEAKLDLSASLDEFERRIGFMAARGVNLRKVRFATSFGRGVDYYTGFEFELHAPGSVNGPLVAGGRYDDLLTRLGASTPIPAVGFAIWIEDLARQGRQA